MHNNYRAQHVNTPPLYWDGGVAATAQAWADNCIFQHSVRRAAATLDVQASARTCPVPASALGDLLHSSCQAEALLSSALGLRATRLSLRFALQPLLSLPAL